MSMNIDFTKKDFNKDENIYKFVKICCFVKLLPGLKNTL